jgi:hypothetical protein
LKNQKITIVFLTALLVAGAATIASPILIDDASATGDRYSDGYDKEKEYDSKYSDDSYDKEKEYDSKYSDDSYDKEKEYDSDSYDSKYSDDSYDKKSSYDSYDMKYSDKK